MLAVAGFLVVFPLAAIGLYNVVTPILKWRAAYLNSNNVRR